MIDYIIPLIASVVSSSLWLHLFIPLICLMFISTVPCIIRQFITLWGH